MNNIPIFCDNTSAVNITKNPVQHSRTKHIKIKHHFIRDHALKGDISIEFVDSLKQLADIFTKPLSENQFCKIRRELGMIDVHDVEHVVLCISSVLILFWHRRFESLSLGFESIFQQVFYFEKSL